MTRPAPPHPDALLSARELARVIRAMQPQGAAGISERAIRDTLRRIGAPRVGHWFRVRWGDWCAAWTAAHLAPPAPAPAPSPQIQPTPDQKTPRDDADRWAADRIAREEQRNA